MGGSRIICEAGNGGVLSIGRWGDVGEGEAGLASVENMEEVGKVGIDLSLFFNML